MDVLTNWRFLVCLTASFVGGMMIFETLHDIVPKIIVLVGCFCWGLLWGKIGCMWYVLSVIRSREEQN